MNDQDLASLLYRIDSKPYPAYKDTKGSYKFPHFSLSIDRVQGDPFASPSRLSIRISHEESGIPTELRSSPSRTTGTETYIAKLFSRSCKNACSHLGSGKSGLISIDTPKQEILKRSCVEIDDKHTTVRFSVGLPANGRRISGKSATKLLTEIIPTIVDSSLLYTRMDSNEALSFAQTNEDADYLRGTLKKNGLIAFVANGAILPRQSGVDQRPMANPVLFKSPDSLKVTVTLPNVGHVEGMGIQSGITLIVGGGYHGKSTLLNAIERGVYNHIPGDGRELVIASRDTTKVRAEDGRSVASVDLSPFINNLPGGKSTTDFSSENASGSTSQAASIIEAIEAGSKNLLIDEDISATNFLIRDSRMQKLISKELEPITPFAQRVRALYEESSISTIIVLGGSSDYFSPAHRVIALQNYLAFDRTLDAKQICSDQEQEAPDELPAFLKKPEAFQYRHAAPQSISPFKSAPPYRGNKYGGNRGARPPRKNIKVNGTRTVVFGTEEIDLSLCSQLVDVAQARTIAYALAYASEHKLFDSLSIIEALRDVLKATDDRGLSILGGNDLAEIRIQELVAALNRLRSLSIVAMD